MMMTFNEVFAALDKKLGEDGYEVKFWMSDARHAAVLTIYSTNLLDGETPFDHQFDEETVLSARSYTREQALYEVYAMLLEALSL
jgi:hypothetical protein